MLSAIPTNEKGKPKSWTIPILIGLVILLSLALSGLSALYYSNILSTNPNVVIVNQTSNNSTNNTGSLGTISNITQIHKNNKNQTEKDENSDHKKDNSNKQDETHTPSNNRT